MSHWQEFEALKGRYSLSPLNMRGLRFSILSIAIGIIFFSQVDYFDSGTHIFVRGCALLAGCAAAGYGAWLLYLVVFRPYVAIDIGPGGFTYNAFGQSYECVWSDVEAVNVEGPVRSLSIRNRLDPKMKRFELPNEPITDKVVEILQGRGVKIVNLGTN